MLKFEERLGYVFWHVEVDSLSRVIPVNVDSAEKGAVPIYRHCIVFLKGGLEVNNVIL